MNQFEMSEILRHLENELSDDKALSEQERAKAAALAEQIKEMLGKSEENKNSDEFLLSKLKEQIEQFEIQHPAITEIVGRLSDLLARAGL